MPLASDLRSAVADHLGPELAELRPAQPLGRPSRLGVGGERHAHAQAIAPPGQERVARLGRQDHLGGRLGPGHDVAQQERGLVEPDLGEDLGRADDRGRERLLVDRRLAGRDRLLGEDLRDLGGVVGE